MSRFSTRTAVAVAAVTVCGGALISCAAVAAPQPGSHTPKPTVSLRNYVDEATTASEAADAAAEAEQQAQYASAVADFPLAMPDGYEFPESLPSDKGAAVWSWPNGRMVAYAVWRCSVAQAARDAHVLNGDDASAETMLENIRSVSDVELPDNSEWMALVVTTDGISWGALEGETGMCYFWLRPFGRWNA